ncbi:MAG: type III polyketide synthase [Pseudomonadota bacterium]
MKPVPFAEPHAPGEAASVTLRALATDVPDNPVDQDETARIAQSLFADTVPDLDRLMTVFGNSGIVKRHMAMPTEWYLQQRDWAERTDTFLDVGKRLFLRAAKQALDDAGLTGADIDCVVTVTSTGIVTPSLEALAAGELGLRSDVLRVPVFGLGCAGGVKGLTIASDLARAVPGRNILLVAVELCSLAFRLDKATKANVVATALFADGAAAAVVSSGSGAHAGPFGGQRMEPVRLGVGQQHTWPDTLGIMGWNIDPTGFEVVFDRAIPPFARRHLKPVIDGFFDNWHLDQSDVARMLFHPGGEKVLQAIEGAYGLPKRTLDIERDILRAYGNMSSPTALFVLKSYLDANAGNATQVEREILVLTALGPGFTAASIPLQVTS